MDLPRYLRKLVRTLFALIYQLMCTSIDDLLPEYLNELQEDTVLDRKVRTTRRGDVEYLRIGLRGSNPSSEKWIEIG